MIVNAFEVKPAASMYQALVQVFVRAAYEKTSASGTRLEGSAKPFLDAFKKATVEHLKKKGLTEYIPGVNIIVGLAEDSVAMFQVANKVTTGGAEMQRLAAQLERKLEATLRELNALGVQRARILSACPPSSGTASCSPSLIGRNKCTRVEMAGQRALAMAVAQKPRCAPRIRRGWARRAEREALSLAGLLAVSRGANRSNFRTRS